MPKRNGLNQDGFSMLALIAVMAAIGGILTIVMGWASIMNENTVYTNQMAQKTALGTAMKTSTRSYASCTNALAGAAPLMNSETGSYADLRLRLPGEGTFLVAQGGGALADYKIEIPQGGLRVTIPAGAVPEISGANRIWTGRLQMVQRSTASFQARQLAPVDYLGVRLTVDPANVVIGCEFSMDNGCTAGTMKLGSNTPSSCIAPTEWLASKCPADAIPFNDRGALGCKTMAQIYGELCPAGKTAVSDGGTGVTCVNYPPR